MNGAILYSGKYGSTAQYAHWIGEATGWAVFDVNDANYDLSEYDRLILGSSVMIFKLSIRNWVKTHWASIENKSIILFTVSGAAAGAKLDGWIADSLTESMLLKMQHVALRGRQHPKELSWWDRIILRIGAWKNDDPEAKKQELEGFDFMDKSSVDPILKLIQQQP